MTLSLLLLELVLLAATTYILCIRWGNTPAESGAYASLLPLMALAVGAETALLLDLPFIGWIWEGILVVIALTILIRAPNAYRTLRGHFGQTIKGHPVAVLLLALVYCLFLIPLLSGKLEMPGPFIINGSDASHWIALPGNIHALSSWLATAHGPAAPILPALMAFCAITFATYALARRYAWPPTAMTVTLMVISMPRLVCLTAAGSTELVHTAGCLLCLLILYRLVERPFSRDFFLLLMTLGFCISRVWLQWLYPLIMVLLTTILILRRHGLLFFKTIISRQNYLPALYLIPTLLFVLYPLLISSVIKAGAAAHVWELPLNPGGIKGALVNGIRYLLEVIHFTRPVDQLIHALLDFGPIDLLERFYRVVLLPLFGTSGAIAPFQMDWAPTAEKAWFGPFGFIVIIPALLYALVKGPRRLKAVAASLVGYFYLMTLIPAWQPGNAALFTLFFTLSGFMAAFSLPPWRFSTRNRYILQTISFLLLFYSLLFNPFGLCAHLLP